MLQSLFLYSLKACIVLTILYLVYHFAFRHNTQYRLKRAALLIILFAALILPIITVQSEITTIPPEPIANQIDTIIGSQVALLPVKENLQPDFSPETESSPPLSLLESVTYLYWIGAGISFLIFVYQLVDLIRIIISGQSRHDLGRELVTHPRVKYPYSFWKWIFLPDDFHINHHEWQLVGEHERAHLKQIHSLDLLCISLIKCLLWFTPAVYYLQKSMRNNHEFLADEQVLKNHDLGDYSKVLLKICLDADSLDIIHSFALKSNLSKRINHMVLPKTSGLKSGISTSILIISLVLTATQVSLYGQEKPELERKDAIFQAISQDFDGGLFSTMEIYKTTGKHPDTWANFLTKGWVPIILLDSHKSIMTTFQESNAVVANNGNGERYFRVSLRKTKNPEIGDPEFTELRKNHLRTELIQKLTVEERIKMYALSKEWTEKYVHQLYPEYPIISELDFMEKNYIVYQSVPSRNNPQKYNVKTVFKSKQVDQLPEPVGGLERYKPA